MRCARLFGPDSPPGAKQTFRAERDAVLVVGAPAGRVVDGDVAGDPTSSSRCAGRCRARPRRSSFPSRWPSRGWTSASTRATAQSYEVRKGEYIQVLDVQGRQCSDFLAFHAGKLQRGLERGLDATTTRTLMGNAYPMPGLHGKFYDQDMDPLVEVVRDTVGRHDTFGLACTAKYYEDAGYFGHVNCTENFNRVAVAAIGIAERTRLARAELLLQHELRRRPDPARRRAVVAARRLRPAAGDRTTSSAPRPPARTTSTPPTPGSAPMSTSASIPPENRFSMAIAHRVTADAEPERHEGDRLPPAHVGAHEELRRVPRLLAAALLRQRGRAGRVLRVPREGRRDGPLAAAQVGDPRPGRRDCSCSAR